MKETLVPNQNLKRAGVAEKLVHTTEKSAKICDDAHIESQWLQT